MTSLTPPPSQARSTSRARILGALGLAVSLAACSSSSSSLDAGGSALDAQAESSVRGDATHRPGTDGNVDAPAGSDVAQIGQDAAPDAAPDAMADSGHDALPDAIPDATREATTSDAPADAAHDPDTGHDSQPDHANDSPVTGPVCGDGTCQASETCASCPQDCGACSTACGDGRCVAASGETCSTCPVDCGACAACGDGICQTSESCASCPQDCGACAPSCGDGSCNGTETCASCPADCGPCTPDCGDGICSASEDCTSCPADCGGCAPACGDGTCNGGEDCSSCPTDCGPCPVSCGNGTCDVDETCSSCPADCGSCTPKLSFNASWTQTFDAPLIAGGSLDVHYDWSRLPTCRATYGANPGWMITVYYTFDLSQTAQQVQVMSMVGGSGPDAGPGQAVQVDPTIPLPADATNIWLWANNTDVSGCSAWDSSFGNNYEFPVFTSATLSGAVNWAGNVNFVFDTSGDLAPQGDIDPAYFFESQFSGEEVTTWVQVEVYQTGITDRTYQNDAVAAQVAAVALLAQVSTTANASDLGASGPLGMQPLEYVGLGGTGNHNFVYRWFPAMLEMDPKFPDGAYPYMYSFENYLGTTPTTIGAPTDSTAMRTMVLSKSIDCSLFPSNPPAEYCP